MRQGERDANSPRPRPRGSERLAERPSLAPPRLPLDHGVPSASLAAPALDPDPLDDDASDLAPPALREDLLDALTPAPRARPSSPPSSSPPPTGAFRRGDPATGVVPRATPRPRSSAPPPPGDRLALLASEIARSGPDELSVVLPRALREGPALLPLLARELPGLLWLDLSRIRPRTRADQISAVSAVLAASGAEAGSHVAPLLAPARPWHVRLCALRVAAQAPSVALVEPLVRMLADDDATLADHAALALCAHRDQPALEAMLGRLRASLGDRSAPPFWRLTAAKTFGRLREVVTVPALIELLAADEPIAGAAREALRILTARDHGAFRLPWHFWWRGQRARSRVEWLLDALDQDAAPMRARAFHELVLLTGEDLGRAHGQVSREDARALRAGFAPHVPRSRQD